MNPIEPVDHEQRAAEWTVALEHHGLPGFVEERLVCAAAGSTPWVASMTPAELLLARTHGIRPVATVSGTCWYHYGYSWTEGHAEGWHKALGRLQREAAAAGANAVVDVRMRTLRHSIGASMDFTLIGTAVKIAGLKPTPKPVVATVPALEFVRLLEAGIVPVGIAVGAQFDWYLNNAWTNGGAWQTQRAMNSWTNQPIMDLTEFWEGIRRQAHAELRRAAAQQGNGVLAHTQFGQLLRRERDKQPPQYLGRHIVIGTVVEVERGEGVSHDVEMVLDMRDRASPLGAGNGPRHSSYDSDMDDQEGSI
ncbi:MAG TPA: heavy metal-binding domain-containing protein [Sphingomonas sp.]|nr:heavy metal-binding domain-containing protein [Sphingomonas sp.]